MPYQTVKIKEGNSRYWICQLLGHWFKATQWFHLHHRWSYNKTCRVCKAERQELFTWETEQVRGLYKVTVEL